MPHNAIGNPPDEVVPPAEWLYARSGQQHGPVSFMDLKGMAESGQLARTDLVWKKGMTEWVAASSVGVFHGIKAPPPIPIPNQPAPGHPLYPLVAMMFFLFVFVVIGGVLYLGVQAQTRSREESSRTSSETDMLRLEQALEQ